MHPLYLIKIRDFLFSHCLVAAANLFIDGCRILPVRCHSAGYLPTLMLFSVRYFGYSI